MSIVFLVILVFNCIIIFTAAELLPQPNTTTIHITNATAPLLLDDIHLSRGREGENAQSQEFGEIDSHDRKKVVGRKGVGNPPDLLNTNSTNATTQASREIITPYLPPTMEKTLTSSATVPNVSSKNSTITQPDKLPSVGNNETMSVTPSTNTTTTTTTTTTTVKPITKSPTKLPSTTAIPTTTAKLTTTSTTAMPKKPTITYSVDDDPSLLKVVPLFVSKDALPLSPGVSSDIINISEPYSQPSQEILLDSAASTNRQYIIPIIAIIFLIPMILGIGTILARRFKYYWTTRHYRRVDFLVDGMYSA